jgi:ATP-dependent DNA ligase
MKSQRAPEARPLALPPVIAPMEAESVDALPRGREWQYEPKWDGFRCLAFRDGQKVHLQSKAGQPLQRYFPEIVAALGAVKAPRFVLDGELVIPAGEALAFDALLQRIHPAASRVRRLAEETPALLIVFDLLADARGRSLLERPLRERRAQLEAFARTHLQGRAAIKLSPTTTRLATAMAWFRSAGRGSLDGVIAKRRDLPYRSGERDGMQKFKPQRTADCVVGGFRYATRRRQVGSLLLGLYDDEGLLHHVGFCSGIRDADKAALTKKLEALVSPPGFTGKAPGGPSRWSNERSTQWQPLRPKLVVEVGYDQITGDRFRHGTSFHRWRPDKAPRQCGLDQLHQRATRPLRLLEKRRTRP